MRSLRHRAQSLLAAALLSGALSCGTMVESAEAGSALKDGGLTCDLSDPCSCAICASTDDCAEGLVCLPARRRGQACPGARSVCSTWP